MEIEQPTDLSVPLAITCRVYTEGPRTGEVNQFVIGAYEQYIDSWGQHLTYSVEDETGRLRKFKPVFRDFPRQRYWELPVTQTASWLVHGGADKEADSPWLAHCALRSREYGDRASTLEMNWPSTTWTPSALVAHLVHTLNGQPVAQAYVSPGFSQFDTAVFQNAKWTSAMRFHGIDMDERVIYTHALEGLKCPAWLTVVGDRFLEQLGGRGALRFRSSDIEVIELGKAVLIRAGEAPTLGDQNAGDRTPLLREVAKVLKPVRYYGKLPRPGPFMDWYARFDD